MVICLSLADLDSQARINWSNRRAVGGFVGSFACVRPHSHEFSPFRVR